MSVNTPPHAVVNRFEKYRMVTIFLVIVLLVFIFEFLLRLTNLSIVEFTYNIRKPFRYHPQWRVDLEPNSQTWLHLSNSSGVQAFNFIITTNEYAIRVPDRPIDNSPTRIEPETKIVHCIGDSFTMGWGLSNAESYPAILDILLDCEYRCLNLGCSGFGTIAETEKSIQLWDKFPGNFSVLQFCTNDYDDDEMAKSHSQKPAFLHSVLDSYNWVKHRFYTPNFPYTLYYLRHFRTLLDGLPNDIAIGKPCLSNTPDFKPIDVGPGMSNPDYGRLSKAALLKYRNFLAEKKVPFMVVALPLGEESIDFTKFCKENDIECYLFDIPGDLQLRNEGHLNQLGNYKLAQFVSSWIKKTKLITP